MHFKKLTKLVNFCVAILILKMEENMEHFWHIILYYFKKGKNATEMQKNCAVNREGAVTDHVKSGVQSFVLEISRWSMLHSWGNQLTLMVIKYRH